MDNLRERNQQSEQAQIPNSWRVERKNKEELPVIQIDQTEGYLALSRISSGRGIQVTNIKDYFFDSNGGIPFKARVLGKVRGGDSASIIKERGNPLVEYVYYSKRDAIDVSFFGPKETSMSLFDNREPKNVLSFGKNGRVEEIRMMKPWIKNVPNSPDILFSNKKNEFIKNNRDCYKVFALGHFRILDQDQPNKLVFVNKEGKREYEIVWDKVMEKNIDGDEVLFFVVTQSHIEGDEEKGVKILKTPIQIDMKEVKSAVLSEPPYSRKNNRLVVPWRDIDRIVGASLSYRYPPQERQR